MTTTLDELVAAMRSKPEIVLETPSGIPTPEAPDVLPTDLRRFYELCGGATLFPRSDYPARVVSPGEFVKTNSVVWRGLDQESLKTLAEDRSWSWYVIASDEKGGLLSIDLAPERLGRCYDSFWDRHAVRGESPVIATTFTDLMRRLLDNEGSYWYWLRSGFVQLGDAYD